MLGGPAGSSTVEHGAHNSPDVGSTPTRPTSEPVGRSWCRGRDQGGRAVPRSVHIVCLTTAAVLAAPGAALAGGQYPSTDPAGGSLLSPGKTVRYDVQPGTAATTVEARSETDGRVLWRRPLTGVYGTTFVTTRSTRAGLSADGSLLVLSSFSRSQPARTSSFALVPTRPTGAVRTLRLAGRLVVRRGLRRRPHPLPDPAGRGGRDAPLQRARGRPRLAHASFPASSPRRGRARPPSRWPASRSTGSSTGARAGSTRCTRRPRAARSSTRSTPRTGAPCASTCPGSTSRRASGTCGWRSAGPAAAARGPREAGRHGRPQHLPGVGRAAAPSSVCRGAARPVACVS